jgi:hypothetical protein
VAYIRGISINALSKTSWDDSLKELYGIQSRLKNINARVIEKVLMLIKKEAIRNLRDSYPREEGLEKRNEIMAAFRIEIDGDKGRLINEHPEVAYVEFGIGSVGENFEHPIADELGYMYNVMPGHKKDHRILKDRNRSKYLQDIDDSGEVDIAVNSWISPKSKGSLLTQGYPATRFLFDALISYGTNEAFKKDIMAIYEKEVRIILKG